MTALSKAEQKALAKAWKEAQRADYLLPEENVQELFEWLEERLDHSGCDHTLRHTAQWLRDHVSPELIEGVMAEMTDMGGFCDCEVLLNCYEDYDIG